MLSRIAVAALAAGALGTPAAHAAPPVTAGCDYYLVARQTMTAGSEVEPLFGYVVGDPSETFVSVYCEVRDNGMPVAATPTRTGSVAAVSRGTVDFSVVSNWDTTELCAVWTTSTDAGDVCKPAVRNGFPPQEAIDLVELVLSPLRE